MTMYRDFPPTEMSDLTSDGIVEFFEDRRATEEDIKWFSDICSSPDYYPTSNIGYLNWNKVKLAFAEKYFPKIAPKPVSQETMAQRLMKFGYHFN